MATPVQQAFPQGQLVPQGQFIVQAGGLQLQLPAPSNTILGQPAVQAAGDHSQQIITGPTALARQGPSPLALQFLVTYNANPRNTLPAPSSRKRYLKVDDAVSR